MGPMLRMAAVIIASLSLTLSLGACGGGGSSGGGGGTPPTPPPTPPATRTDPTPGTLTRVGVFGTGAYALTMYAYVPAGLTDNRPLVVVLPGCTGKAPEYDVEPGWVRWADDKKFTLVIPETIDQQSACFPYFYTSSQQRGSGEPEVIMQMIQWMQVKYKVDASRIFVTGFSGGGGFTNVMMATYPDVFAAGAPIAGIPYKCTDTASIDACLNGGATYTPDVWAARVRNAYPGYSGPYPRVSIWYGTTDTTVYPAEAIETLKQWTAVHGEDQVPELSDTVAGYPHQVFGSGAGKVEIFEITGMGHKVPGDPGDGLDHCGPGGPTIDVDICATSHIARWFGLDS